MQAAKKLAQYIRLEYRALGGGLRRRLQVWVTKGSKSCPDHDAVEALVAKIEETETTYATTKRLPLFGALPQAPGTQAHFAGWQGGASGGGFGARQLEAMGLDLVAAASVEGGAGMPAGSTGRSQGLPVTVRHDYLFLFLCFYVWTGPCETLPFQTESLDFEHVSMACKHSTTDPGLAHPHTDA